MYGGLVFAVFIFLSVEIFVHAETSRETKWETEVEALKQFKLSIIDDPFGALNEWTNDAIRHCNWSGITCDSSGHVISITYEEKKLHGSISPFIGNLTNLKFLDLRSNSFFGNIPYQLLHCSNLVELNLCGNSFSGEIPSELGYLKHLNLLEIGKNSFNGNIPNSICNCTSLEILVLSDNNFTGVLPPNIGNLINLQVFAAFGNYFEGNIPRSIRNLKALEKLRLGENQLSGAIPASLSGLRHLHSLDLSSNKFTGHIPESIGTISGLISLNLSFNQLEGHVPDKGIFLNISNSSLIGNPYLCGYPLSKACNPGISHYSSKKNTIILIVIVFALVIAFVPFGIYFYRRFKMKEHIEIGNSRPYYAATYPFIRYTINDLKRMTHFFNDDNIIGFSSLSTVYKGKIEDNDQIVAIKILNLSQFSTKSEKSFDREAKTLCQLRHRNLVKVLGYAYESRKLYALVLQYMDNGNLDSIIHGSVLDQDKWTTTKRIDVLISIASGLIYLHSGYDVPIIHCDLKPANVLLDAELTAHVSDFGTARMLDIHLGNESNIASSSLFEGTIGYLAPEFAYMKKITTKVDIFSYGVLIMEILTKRRPTGLTNEEGEPITLSQLVQQSLEHGINGLQEVVDPQLIRDVFQMREAIEGLLSLALTCTNTNPKDRPDMDEVLSFITKLNMISSHIE